MTRKQEQTLSKINDPLVALGFERIKSPYEADGDTRVWFSVKRSSLRSIGPTDPSIQGIVYIVIDGCGSLFAGGHAEGDDQSPFMQLFARDEYWPHSDKLSVTAVLLQLCMHMLGSNYCYRHSLREAEAKIPPPPAEPKPVLYACFLCGSCWELRDEKGKIVSTASRSDTPEEAEDKFRTEYPDAEIEFSRMDYDAYLRDHT